MLSWKIPEFCSVGGARSQNSIFRVLGYPSTILRTGYRKQFYPKPMIPMESRDSEGVPFASLESVTRHLADIGPLKGAEKWWRDHHENWKFACRHMYKKIHWFQIRYSSWSTTKNNEVITEKPFQDSGVTRRLAVLNWCSSSIHPSS